MRRAILILILLPAVLHTIGCSGKRRENPILQLSAAEALEMGKELLTQEKYYKAEQHLTHAFEVEPNSRSGREALLLAADSLFLRGGTDSFIRCEAKYRDFLNRFPTSERADYAQFQVANCLAKRTERPDRDQKVTRMALEAYEELLRLYPTSSYIPAGRQKIGEVNDLLAAHELVVAKFYVRFGSGSLCIAAVRRLEFVRGAYPEFSRMDEVLLQLGKAYGLCQQPDASAAALRKLRSDYPDSEFLEQATKVEKELAKRRRKEEAG